MHVPLVTVHGSVSEQPALVLPEEDAVAELDVVNLIARVTAVDLLPLLRGSLTLSEQQANV